MLADRIAEADLLVLGTPIDIGHVSGQFKCLLDRWYAFLESDFTNQVVAGKRYITVTCSGAPADSFRQVTNYLNEWLGNFFQMTCMGNLVAGDLGEAGAVLLRPDLLEEARQLGAGLSVG